MPAILPRDLTPAGTVNPASAIIIDDGSGVKKATPAELVDSGRPIASQGEAEAGVVSDKGMTPQRVKQAIDALGVSQAVLGSSTGGAMVGFLLDAGDAVLRTAEEKLSDFINAADFGVVADGVTDSTVALQNAIDYARGNNRSLDLPTGEILINGDIQIDPISGGGVGELLFDMAGKGVGENGTWLHFSSGSLIIKGPHQISNFRVTSDDADGISISAASGPTVSSSRSSMTNVRAEGCAGSGIVLSDMFIYTMNNCYARNNAEYGLKTVEGAIVLLAVNSLTIIGGEYQGNGAIAGTPTGSGGSLKGTGGGMLIGQGYQINLYGVTIEGNVGDGLWLDEGVRGLIVDGCYFEKNGSHPDNRDIGNDQPGSAANGPNSISIRNCNFTPQATNGTAQTHAIDIWDAIDLRITNPQILLQLTGPVLYTGCPIRVRESTAARSTGWVEGGWYSSTSYTQAWVLNETHRFGFPRKYVFTPEVSLTKGAGDTSTQKFRLRMSSAGCFGRRVDVEMMTRPASGTGVARLQRILSRGPATTNFSNTAYDVTYASSTASVYTPTNSANDSLPGTHVEVMITRNESNVNDTLAASVVIQSLEVTLYEGRVSAS